MDMLDFSVDSEVQFELGKLFYEGRLSPEILEVQVARLDERFGEQVYTALLFSLCQLRFAPDVARAHWSSVVTHWSGMSEGLGGPVDLRVALLDYFLTLNGEFHTPGEVELQIVHRTPGAPVRDGLTGVHSFQYFRSDLEREISRSDRSRLPFAIALFDVDHFAWYNDRNGYLAGNRALRTVAGIVRREVRQSDLVARYSGEAFAVLFPGLTGPEALEVSSRVCQAVAAHPFDFAQHQPSGRFSISGGVAAYGENATDAQGLIIYAAGALQRAKAEGKDRILRSTSNCRAHSRVEVDIPGTLQLLASQPEELLAGNLSEEGLLVRCSIPVPAGSYLRFSLRLPDTDREIEGVACAVRPSRRIEGKHEVGVQIVEISDTDLAHLRSHLESLRRRAEVEDTIS